jgi:hypothetical protein
MPRFANAEYAALISGSEMNLLTCTWKVHRSLVETGTLMPHARAGRGRRNVRDQGDVLDSAHQPAVATLLIQQEDFLTEQHGILCVRVSCTVSCTASERVAAQDKHNRPQISRWVLRKIVYIFCSKLSRQQRP